MSTAAAITPRTAAVVAAIVTAMDLHPANDNAGLAWRLGDDEPYVDDFRSSVDVRHRDARRIAPALDATVRAAPMASAWLVYGVGDCCGRVAVRFGSGLVASRATRRRLAVVTELLRAGGLDVWRG